MKENEYLELRTYGSGSVMSCSDHIICAKILLSHCCFCIKMKDVKDQ
jgi:hypothetical protein